MWSVRDFEGKLMEGWERRRNDAGISYYIRDSEHTQWDHPLLRTAAQDISNCNNIKYVAYRTASKCLILQKFTQLQKVKLPTIVSHFDQHGIKCGLNEDVMQPEQLETLLLDIYSHALRDQSPLHLQTLSEVAANIFLNIYDKNRTGIIRVSSIKIALSLFCSARLQEKYKYLFRQFADHNNCISKTKLTEVLRDISYIPEYLSEKPSFGSQLVDLAVGTCYKPEEYTLGVTEEAFLNWLLREPQTLVWISTLYRITCAEKSVHEIKCNICKEIPFTGLRYRCLRCFQFDLCQNCFFTGQSNKRHKLYHPLQEYCYRSTSKEETKAFLTTIKNIISKKTVGNTKQRYLPISQAAVSTIDLVASTTNCNNLIDDGVSSKCASEDHINQNCETTLDPRTVNFESLQLNEADSNIRQKDLKDFINYLEEENRQLKAEVENFRNATMRGSGELNQCSSLQNVENNPSLQLECKLNKLKSMLMNLQTYPNQFLMDESLDSDVAQPPRYESTPARFLGSRQVFHMDSPMDPRFDRVISNIPSPQSPPLQTMPFLDSSPQQFDRSFGNLPSYARRSLPLTTFQRAYPPSSVFHQPSKASNQRSSARAILQTKTLTISNNSALANDLPVSSNHIPTNYPTAGTPASSYYVDEYAQEEYISNGSRVDVISDVTSNGFFRIQNELESIIRQLEAIYPGCSAQQTLVSGNVSDKYRIMTAANEIESMLRDLVAKVTMAGTPIEVTHNSTEHIPNEEVLNN